MRQQILEQRPVIDRSETPFDHRTWQRSVLNPLGVRRCHRREVAQGEERHAARFCGALSLSADPDELE